MRHQFFCPLKISMCKAQLLINRYTKAKYVHYSIQIHTKGRIYIRKYTIHAYTRDTYIQKAEYIYIMVLVYIQKAEYIYVNIQYMHILEIHTYKRPNIYT